MTITHAELVANLAKPGEEIMKTFDAHDAHIAHMLLGLAGEVGEVFEVTSRENAIEEAGDIYFYLEGVWQGLSLDRPPQAAAFVFDPEIGSKPPGHQVVIYMGRVIDAIKKSMIYRKGLNRAEAVETLTRLDIALVWWLSQWNATREEAIAGNIAKLSKRYSAGKYSNEQAQARADKKIEVTLKVDASEAIESVKQAQQQEQNEERLTKGKLIVEIEECGHNGGAPLGWWCHRPKGHEGACAAVAIPVDVSDPANPKEIITKQIPEGAWGTKEEDYGDRFAHLMNADIDKGSVK
jgi:hypothetical protein